MLRFRRHLLDVFLVLLAAAEVVSVLTSSTAHKPAAVVLSALSALVFLGRRWQPLAVTVIAFAAITLLGASMPQSTLPQFFGLLVTFALAGAINRERDAVVAWVAGAAAVFYQEYVNSGQSIGDYALTMAFCTMLWAAGLLLSRRTRQAELAMLRAELAERDREEEARRAVVEERARIARELHDIVSHGLSVVVLQTLAARASLQDGGNDVDRHLDAVESTARDALGEMRRMLGLLSTNDGVEPAGEPQRGLNSVPELLDRATAAGVRLTSVELPTGLELPSGLDLAVYRVVQEALTNVAKHAPGAATSLSVCASDAEVVVRVSNAADGAPSDAPAGAGHGLIGMRQRVELYGGSLTAAETDDGGFTVTATFLLDDVVAPAGARL